MGHDQLFLDDREEHIHKHLFGGPCRGLVLLVPQEVILPTAELLDCCSGVLCVMPRRWGHRGLPSQVATAIALQRLLTIRFPPLKL